MDELRVLPAVTVEPVERYARWLAIACVIIGLSDLLAVSGTLYYWASLAWLGDPTIFESENWMWLVEQGVTFSGLLLLVGGWGMLQRRDWGRSVLLIWAVVDVVLTFLVSGISPADYFIEWHSLETRVQGFAYIPTYLATGLVLPGLATVLLTRASVRQMGVNRAFEVVRATAEVRSPHERNA